MIALSQHLLLFGTFFLFGFTLGVLLGYSLIEAGDHKL